MKRRFIGGALDGQLKDIPEGQRMISHPVGYDYKVTYAYANKFVSNWDEAIKMDNYGLKEIRLASCRLYVFVLVGLSEEAMWRSIADLVEGV